jgi:tRNA U34 5-methylaminomethyl-2-thiouridine-forming methyltransferase MnmC
MKAPHAHTLCQTQDGSWTLFSDMFQESAHSTHGAKNETRLRYIDGCELERACALEQFHIFETGFGLGTGLLSTLNFFREKNIKAKLHFVSCEIQKDLVEWLVFSQDAKELLTPDYGAESVKILQSLRLSDQGFYTYENEFLKVMVIAQDITTCDYIKKTFNNYFHAIFQDAYGPKKNPDLWTEEWFKTLYGMSAPDVILSTYCSSKSATENMQKAQWKTMTGLGFGPKKSSTKATK